MGELLILETPPVSSYFIAESLDVVHVSAVEEKQNAQRSLKTICICPSSRALTSMKEYFHNIQVIASRGFGISAITK